MNITGKFLKVWGKEETNGFTKLTLGDSNKKQDGTYDNFKWFGCTLIGNAKNTTVNEGDVLEIKSGIILKREYNGKWYDDIRIFDCEVTGQYNMPDNKPTQQPTQSTEPVINDETDDLPF